MKKMIQWETFCEPLHAGGLCCAIEQRTAAQFKRLIQNAEKWPLLMDVHEAEADAFFAAAESFRMLGRAYHRHIDALRHQAGFGRFAIYPPSMKRGGTGGERAAFMFTPAEIASVAANTAFHYEALEPDATKERTNAARRKANRKTGTESTKAKAEANRQEIRRLYMHYKAECPKWKKEALQRRVSETHPRKRGFSMRVIQANTKDL